MNVPAFVQQLRLLCESPDCRKERLYMGKQCRRGKVIMSQGHKWDNSIYYNHTGGSLTLTRNCACILIHVHLWGTGGILAPVVATPLSLSSVHRGRLGRLWHSFHAWSHSAEMHAHDCKATSHHHKLTNTSMPFSLACCCCPCINFTNQ